ncbi:flagellar filament capping protein FliD [Clostridium estertheticum]|uniref:flagellar filament capping protein FliD n=1 Tax=Clostridium estertheticum TaxID=238834 RepID=UPI001C0B0774|nr:flagellar filament capping protein FliD [Clostridium estertheticum]MBU3214281.1 flagellar filament capping protein FliD [Clostridium estertheticum]WAG54704.1 flagellar filament capping protein FliD [Clostridium estertheticum]
MTSIYASSTNATNSTSSANLLRISGMASGIDTDAVVKSMVSNYQAKIDKANQAKQTLQWQQEGYRDIIKGIKGLQDYFDPLSTKYMMSGNSLNTNTAASDDAAVVSATSGSTAKAGTYKVNVSQLAKQAKIEGNPKDSMIAVTQLSDWNGVLNFNDTTTGKAPIKTTPSITLSGIAASTPTDANMSNLAVDINKQIAASTLNGKISASYVKDGGISYIKFTESASTTDNIGLSKSSPTTATAITSLASDLTINSGISSSSLLSTLGFPTGANSFNLTNGTASSPVSFTVGTSTTVQNLMDQVNSATSGAVTMNIDDTTGKISFQSKNYGSSSNVGITGASASVLKSLGMATTTNATTVDIGTGADAVVAITAPGQSTATTTQSSNKFTVNGVTYNLTGVNTGTETSNVTVTSNSDTVVSNVKKFIEDYNTIISTINTKLTEKKDKNYAPLTDAQRTSMSDTQITTWEAKAKVGILRKDDNLSSLLTQLRGTLYSPVYSTSDSADASTGKIALNFGGYGSGAVGIETSADTTDGGKLVIKAGNEAKLKSVIENNMEDFKKLFIGSSSSTLSTNEAYAGSKKYKEDGIFKRMDNILRDYVASPGLGKDGGYTLSGSMNIFVNKQYDFSLSGTAGKNTLPDQVYSKTQSVSKYQTQLEAAQTRYYAKFTALEKAMNALNSQQSSLSSMLGTSSS